MTLRATTCLAENTDPMLRRWIEHLQGIGIDIEFDEGLTTSERLAMASSGEVDVLFACGLQTMELIALGTPLDVVAAPVFDQRAGDRVRLLGAGQHSNWRQHQNRVTGRCPEEHARRCDSCRQSCKSR